jgi:hypothetical protein
MAADVHNTLEKHGKPVKMCHSYFERIIRDLERHVMSPNIHFDYIQAETSHCHVHNCSTSLHANRTHSTLHTTINVVADGIVEEGALTTVSFNLDLSDYFRNSPEAGPGSRQSTKGNRATSSDPGRWQQAATDHSP